MRRYMEAARMLVEDEAPVLPEETTERAAPGLLANLRDLVFKMRAINEDAGGDYALGFEMGMQRAAEMVENLVRRHAGDDA